jgi:hypothetical protein
MREICATRVRYGYRRVHVLLRREGWEINLKKTHRIYNELGLQLRNKTPKRRVKAKLRDDRRSFQDDPSGIGATAAEQRFKEFRAPGGDKSENPHDLARTHIERNRPNAGRKRAFDRKQRGADRPRQRIGPSALHALTYDRCDDLVSIEVGRSRRRARLWNRDTIRKGEDLAKAAHHME